MLLPPKSLWECINIIVLSKLTQRMRFERLNCDGYPFKIIKFLKTMALQLAKMQWIHEVLASQRSLSTNYISKLIKRWIRFNLRWIIWITRWRGAQAFSKVPTIKQKIKIQIKSTRICAIIDKILAHNWLTNLKIYKFKANLQDICKRLARTI